MSDFSRTIVDESSPSSRWVAKGRRHLGVAVIATASMGVLAACGSSEENQGAGGGGSKADVAGAKAFTTKYQAAPTSFNLTPLASAPEPGKKLALVFGNTPNERSILNGAREAARTLGWTTTPIVYDPSKPTGLRDAFAKAVEDSPDGVVTAGTDATTYAPAAKQLAAAKIPVVTSSTTDSVKAPIIANVANAEQTALVGRMTANYVVAQQGADANVAMFNAPSFAILDAYEKAFKGEYLRLCPDCGYKAVPIQYSDVGTKLPAQIVSTIQTDPKINYVIMGSGDMSAGVPAALRGAGISDVKIGGEAPGVANISNLKGGSEDMWVGYPLQGIGWKSVDALARHFNGEPTDVGTSAPTPFRILTKANAPDPAALPEVTDYQGYFEKLWKGN